jgi:hypothetical protein
MPSTGELNCGSREASRAPFWQAANFGMQEEKAGPLASSVPHLEDTACRVISALVTPGHVSRARLGLRHLVQALAYRTIISYGTFAPCVCASINRK